MDVKAKYTGLTIALAKAEMERNGKKTIQCLKDIVQKEKEIAELKKRAIAYAQKKVDIGQALEQYIEKKSEFAVRLREVKAKRK